MKGNNGAERNLIKFPIGFKLITVITILLLVSLGGLIVLVSIMVGANVRITAETNNMEINNRAVFEAAELLNRVRSV